MNLTTFSFVYFCIITLLIYFIVPKKGQWFVLLLSSLYFLFYKDFNISTLFYVLVIFLAAYFSAIFIDKYARKKQAKWFLIGGIFLILSQLILLKYVNLFLVTINHICHLFGQNINLEITPPAAPLGISYYSLIMISYIIDVYRGLCKPQKNPLKCALFMTYFPILTSGPFIRYPDMEKKLYTKHKFNYDNLCRGLIRILWGLFKILVISQRLGIIVDTVYQNYSTYSGLYIIMAVLFFTMQLYTNFSGSIDIIMGVSKIMGIELPENFHSPFFSRTITELWRNWHITLGAWLKDYVFYPLMKSNLIQKIGTKTKKLFGKKVSKKITLYISMLIMWILIGAWHSGEYKFIIGSGILQFIYMVFEDLLAPIVKKGCKKLRINPDSFGYKLYQCLRTYLLFSLAMIFFRASSVSNALEIIKNMFIFKPGFFTNIFNLGLNKANFVVLIFCLIILFIIEYLQIKEDVIEDLFTQNIVVRWILIYALIFAVLIFGMYGPKYDQTIFIYQQF